MLQVRISYESTAERINIDAKQTSWMRGVVDACVVRMQQNHFLHLGPRLVKVFPLYLSSKLSSPQLLNHTVAAIQTGPRSINKQE